jgi:hypothetical protein
VRPTRSIMALLRPTRSEPSRHRPRALPRGTFCTVCGHVAPRRSMRTDVDTRIIAISTISRVRFRRPSFPLPAAIGSSRSRRFKSGVHTCKYLAVHIKRRRWAYTPQRLERISRGYCPSGLSSSLRFQSVQSGLRGSRTQPWRDPWQSFRHLALPIIGASVLGVAMLGFTLSWDEIAPDPKTQITPHGSIFLRFACHD